MVKAGSRELGVTSTPRKTRTYVGDFSLAQCPRAAEQDAFTLTSENGLHDKAQRHSKSEWLPGLVCVAAELLNSAFI